MEKQKQQGDYLVIIIAVLLSLFGLVMIYASSNYSAFNDYGDKFYFVKKQAVGLGVGLAAMFIMSRLSYIKLKKLKYIALIVSVVMLLLVFVPFIGVEKYGAKRWIGIGSFTIQSSEIAKIGFVIFCSAYISDNAGKMKSFVYLLPILLSGGLICVLIIIEPNMSITVCVALIMLIMLFCGGAKIKHFLLILLPVAALGIFLILAEPYRLNRLSAFLNPWASPKDEGYQLLQSLYALGSGGFFGVGLFNSRQKLEFLPFAESDFILSIIGEELGFLGCLILLFVFLLLIYRGIKIAISSRDLFGFMLAIGITSIIAVQTMINILVVTGSIPPTGLPLPFISMGNTSLIVLLAEVGVLFNISKRNAKNLK